MMNSLIGKWISKSHQNPFSENIRMYFTEEGSLVYVIKTEDAEQIILLTYFIEDDYLITDQPSAPHIEKTQFLMPNANTLLLIKEGKIFEYTREA